MNNVWQVKAKSDYAIMYAERSVLENHHLAKLFGIMKEKPEFAIFDSITDLEVVVI